MSVNASQDHDPLVTQLRALDPTRTLDDKHTVVWEDSKAEVDERGLQEQLRTILSNTGIDVPMLSFCFYISSSTTVLKCSDM
ncbi:hypothetical protein HDV00_000211 [Rhizophlyctis rosea]|nr:hypothetical protein HDV00_000211 [Rhizophlyctis rosea]